MGMPVWRRLARASRPRRFHPHQHHQCCQLWIPRNMQWWTQGISSTWLTLNHNWFVLCVPTSNSCLSNANLSLQLSTFLLVTASITCHPGITETPCHSWSSSGRNFVIIIDMVSFDGNVSHMYHCVLMFCFKRSAHCDQKDGHLKIYVPTSTCQSITQSPSSWSYLGR